MVDFLVGFSTCLTCVSLPFELDSLSCELCSTVFALGSSRTHDFPVLCFSAWSASTIKSASEMSSLGLLVFPRSGASSYCFSMLPCLTKLTISPTKSPTKSAFFGATTVAAGSAAGVCKRAGATGTGEGTAACDVPIAALARWLISDTRCCPK